MFEAAEVGNVLNQATYQREAPKVRAALLAAQHQLASTGLSIVTIIDGNEGGGKGDTVNLLLEWMDARGIQTHAMGKSTDEERDRPEQWRFWRRLPPQGRLAIFFGAWYRDVIIRRALGDSREARFRLELDQIVDLERMLACEGVVVVKFWLHLSKAAQKARFKELEADSRTSWRVSKLDWKYLKHYDEFRPVSEQALRKTSIAEAPWHIVEGTDARYRNLTVATTLLQTLRECFARHKRVPAREPPASLPVPKPVNVLSALDLTLAVDDDTFKKTLLNQHAALNRLLSRKLQKAGRAIVLVFEGPDAAGKGGTIRRLTPAMMPGSTRSSARVRPPTKSAPSLPLALLATRAACRPFHDL